MAEVRCIHLICSFSVAKELIAHKYQSKLCARLVCLIMVVNLQLASILVRSLMNINQFYQQDTMVPQTCISDLGTSCTVLCPFL